MEMRRISHGKEALFSNTLFGAFSGRGENGGFAVCLKRRNVVLFPFWGLILGQKQNFCGKMLGRSESLPYLCQRLKNNGKTIPAGSGDCSEVLRAFFICPKTQSGTTPAEDILAVVFRKNKKSPPG